MKWGHVSWAPLWSSHGETLWRCVTPKTVVRPYSSFFSVIISSCCSSFLCSPRIKWLIIVNTSLMCEIKSRAVWQTSGSCLNWVWNVCFWLSGFLSLSSCLSTWKTSIKFWFPLNHMAKPVTGANQLSLTGELTHELGWCWVSLPEKTESWGFKTWAISQILLCTLPERLYLLFITTPSTWSV